MPARGDERAHLPPLHPAGLHLVRAYGGDARGVPKLRVVSPPPGALASPLLTYRLPADVESGAFQRRMREKHRIELKMVPKNWFNGHRVSTHLFNTEQEVDALVDALRAELAP